MTTQVLILILLSYITTSQSQSDWWTCTTKGGEYVTCEAPEPPPYVPNLNLGKYELQDPSQVEPYCEAMGVLGQERTWAFFKKYPDAQFHSAYTPWRTDGSPVKPTVKCLTPDVRSIKWTFKAMPSA